MHYTGKHLKYGGMRHLVDLHQVHHYQFSRPVGFPSCYGQHKSRKYNVFYKATTKQYSRSLSSIAASADSVIAREPLLIFWETWRWELWEQVASLGCYGCATAVQHDAVSPPLARWNLDPTSMIELTGNLLCLADRQSNPGHQMPMAFSAAPY